MSDLLRQLFQKPTGTSAEASSRVTREELAELFSRELGYR
jgi:hypothetical protein